MLVDNPALIQIGRAHIKGIVPGVLLQILAIGIHRPDVHHPVPVSDKIHPALVPHGIMALPQMIGGQFDGLIFTVKLPDLTGLPTYISLCVDIGVGGTNEEPIGRFILHPFACLMQGNNGSCFGV